jgi:glycosyltransferase involved in cell wall biosynthesis
MVAALRIRGPFLGPTGYDYHVREFTRVFVRRGIGVELMHLEGWSSVQLPFELREPQFEQLHQPVDAQAMLHFTLPSHVAEARDPWVPNINFTMFESTRIPPMWAVAHRFADVIVVPTEHSRQAWVASGVPEEKLQLARLGVRTDLFRPGVPSLEVEDVDGRPFASYAVRLLNVSEVGPRKNLVGLIEAWLSATHRGDDAVLAIKVGEHSASARAELEWTVAEAQQRAGRRVSQAAPITFIRRLLPDADLPRLFALGTHYVSLSHGEGWDLAMIQAAASGLRLIAPRHSGYLAYLDDDIATLVDVREEPAATEPGSWAHALFAGMTWWSPDEGHAAAAIRAAVEGRDVHRLPARERMVEHFTWDHAADELLAVVDEAVASATRRPVH